MECGKIDIEDCSGCSWLGYDMLENEAVCMLHDERPIGEIESCNGEKLTVEQETLILEQGRDNNYDK